MLSLHATLNIIQVVTNGKFYKFLASRSFTVEEKLTLESSSVNDMTLISKKCDLS